MHQQTLRIAANQRLGQRFFRLSLRMPDPHPWAAAVPGQFVHLAVPFHGELVLRRPLSIYDVDNNLLVLVYKVVGKGTDALSRCPPGTPVDILGPLGTGFPYEAAHRPVIVGGGYGIAPLFRLAKHFADRCTVVYGAATAEELVCRSDLETLGCRLRLLTEDGSAGDAGTTVAALHDLLETKEVEPDAIFACGPEGMLREVTALARRYRIPAWISLETHMACGVGACLGCAVRVKSAEGERWLRACVDGPVFPAEKVVWNIP